MTDTRRPNEIRRKEKAVNVVNSDQPNAIDRKTIPMWLRKKRHMSGLMCPQPGFIPSKEMLSKLKGK